MCIWFSYVLYCPHLIVQAPTAGLRRDCISLSLISNGQTPGRLQSFPRSLPDLSFCDSRSGLHLDETANFSPRQSIRASLRLVMARLPIDAGVSLEQDRFEVDCWRYVGDPVGNGRGSGKPRVGVLDLGKSGASGSGDKSEGWFGVSIWSLLFPCGASLSGYTDITLGSQLNKHKRNRTISVQKKNRPELAAPNHSLPPLSGSASNSNLSTAGSSRNLVGSSASSTFSSSSGSTLRSSLPSSAGQNSGVSESASGLGASLGKKGSKGKKGECRRGRCG